MSKNAKLNAVSFSGLYGNSPTVSIMLSLPNGGSLHKTLSTDKTNQIIQLIFDLVLENKKEIAESIQNLEAPLLITSTDKVIENEEEYPF